MLVDSQLFTFASNFCNMVRYINIHFIDKEVTVSINIQYALKFKSYLNLMKIHMSIWTSVCSATKLCTFILFSRKYIMSSTICHIFRCSQIWWNLRWWLSEHLISLFNHYTWVFLKCADIPNCSFDSFFKRFWAYRVTSVFTHA